MHWHWEGWPTHTFSYVRTTKWLRARKKHSRSRYVFLLDSPMFKALDRVTYVHISGTLNPIKFRSLCLREDVTSCDVLCESCDSTNKDIITIIVSYTFYRHMYFGLGFAAFVMLSVIWPVQMVAAEVWALSVDTAKKTVCTHRAALWNNIGMDQSPSVGPLDNIAEKLFPLPCHITAIPDSL